MKMELGGREYTLKYTFNSFRYMEDFDLGELAELENKPFKMVRILHTLLLGAMNYDPKKVYNSEQVSQVLNVYLEDNNPVELIENLVELMGESSFFRNLQKNQ